MKNKFLSKFLIILCVSLILSNCNDTNKEYVSYKIEHTDGYTYNSDSDFCINSLNTDGIIISLNFDQIGNSKKHKISLSIKTINPINNLFIDTLNIKYKTIETDFAINESYKLDFQETGLFTQRGDKIFGAFISCDEIDLNKLLNTIESEMIPLQMKLKGNIDNSNFSYSYTFVAKRYMRKRSASDLMYNLFPGM